MRLCSIFGAVFCGKVLFYVAVMQFHKTKRFVVFRNVRVILLRFAVCGFFLLFCPVFICNSVRFCSIRTPIMPPSISFIIRMKLRTRREHIMKAYRR